MICLQWGEVGCAIATSMSLVTISNGLLDVSNRLTGVETLGAHLGAVHDGVASVQLERIVQEVQALLSELVSAVLDPLVGLHQDGGTEVVILRPPVTGTGSAAASTQNTLVHTVQLLAVLLGLQMLAALAHKPLGRLVVVIGGTRAVIIQLLLTALGLEPGLD